MNLVLLEPHEVDGHGGVRLSGERARHLTAVLHVVPGQLVRLGQLDGPHGVGTVTAVDGADVLLECQWEEAVPPRPQVDLLLALPRPKVLRRLWSQIAALGVGHVILTNAARVERHYFDAHVLEPATYHPLLVEGLQQARDTRLPVVSVHRRFRPLVEDDLATLFPAGRRLVGHPGETRSTGHALDGDAASRVLLAVGPEGGWSEFELDLLARHGFSRVGMGARPLRSDTATIALLSLVHDGLWRASGPM
jgi:RsmE family RNA methyltransferase